MHYVRIKMRILFLSIVLFQGFGNCQRPQDEPPYLEAGGDLLDFELPENTRPNSEVYTLKGRDPEGSGDLSYTISGDYFSVDRKTGVITLREPLDRERESAIEVVVTVQDAAYNLIPFRREIRISDVNDNAPVFVGEPYGFDVQETVPIGQTLFSSIVVSDADIEDNARIELECVPQSRNDESCDIFDVRAQELETGSYLGLVSLKKPLDYEARSSYTLKVRARDFGVPRSLSSTTDIFIQIQDIQDQAPFFMNSPYSSTVPENTPPGTKIFDIRVRDGDTGIPRKIVLDIVGDSERFFVLDDESRDEQGVLSATLKIAPDGNIDRENTFILEAGGLYTFQLRARELLEGSTVFGDEVFSNVTIVITDQDDSVPIFNKNSFTVAVPEEVGPDTPLPDLNIIVSDADVSNNAAFELILENPGPFSVYPSKAIGRTPVILRVSNPELLDYESEDKKKYVVKINAVQDGQILSSCTVNVLITDSNDNSPVFDQDSYEFNVREDAPAGLNVGSITAVDADSGIFGQVEYNLKGFGADKFRVNPESGEIFVNSCSGGIGFEAESCLDYETQDVYSLTYTGTDGGNQVTTTSVNIRIIDVNDNYPKFIIDSYARTVEEGATVFEPRLIIEATDADGQSQGGGKVFYSIKSINTDETIFDVDPVSGEMSILKPIPGPNDDEIPADGRYELVVRATDSGKPPLYSDVKVQIDVGTIRNLKPVFEPDSYDVILPENAVRGMGIVVVKATDPDGPDEMITYKIHSGAKDNFVINATTGEISVSEDAELDIQENGDHYDIIIHGSDNGKPYEQVSKATVGISIRDINNKPPKFEDESYITYVNERKSVGEEVLTVTATDVDRNAILEYDIIEPITAMDKAGNVLTNKATYDYTSSFGIDPTNGKIFVNSPLSYNSAAVIILTIQVMDKNAFLPRENLTSLSDEKEKNPQVDNVEATFYIQAFKADSPQFGSPWTPSDPTLSFLTKEEMPVGSFLFELNAHDPIKDDSVIRFEKSELSDPENLILVNPETGEVTNNKVFDYDSGLKKITFSVKAIAEDEEGKSRLSEANVILSLEDVNDNFPVFEMPEYRAEISESALPMSAVLNVHALDQDSGSYGEVRYSLIGEGSEAFSIHPTDGKITVRAGLDGRSNVDREKIDEYRLQVLAKDIPEGGAEQKVSSVEALITVTDVNDTPPRFSESSYSAVVPENSPIGTFVTKVSATDDDLGLAGEVEYQFAEKSKLDGIYSIDRATGEITTSSLLTGKGRRAPYVLLVRSMDKGDPGLFTDVEVYITVGDVSSNDGVPTFIRPLVDEVAYVAENSSLGTKVFQVMASDPDDPNTANGKIVYTLPDDGSVIRKLFKIDPVSGLLTTKVKLDREERENYTLILEVKDLGTPPQQTSRTLTVVVKDINDHAPIFQRQRNSVPIEVELEEHVDVDTKVVSFKAIDLDEGENAKINYAIIDGNDENLFDIMSTGDNEGIVIVSKDIDREKQGEYILTIKCFHPNERSEKAQKKKYKSSNLDEMRIKVKVLDIDDNPPRFLNKNATYGVRVNSAVYTEIATIKAVDIDAEAEPIKYDIVNITYTRPKTGLLDILDKSVFIIDRDTGVLQSNRTMGRFIDGQFVIFVKAQNTPEKYDLLKIKIYVLQDTELMRFVFNQDPTVVRKKLPNFKNEIESAFAQPLTFNIYDTEFYSKGDGSLDFGRTSSCFQLLGDEELIDLKSSETLIKDNGELEELFRKYDIVDVERCARIQTSKTEIRWIEIALMFIGVFVGLFSIIASCTLCCLYSRFKRNIYRNSPVKIVEAPVRAYIPTSLPPGSIIHGGGAPSIAGSDGRVLYDSWHQQDTIPADLASYRSLPNH